MLKLIASVILTSVLTVTPYFVNAQEDVDDTFLQAFSGLWFVFDPSLSTSGNCTIELSPDLTPAGIYGATSLNCTEPLSDTAAWKIDNGQIRLLPRESSKTIVALGGNQYRISGGVDGTESSVILERSDGDEASRKLREAISKYRCIYRGFTSKCAQPEELKKAEFRPTTTTRIRTLVNLNVRTQPRSDAAILGVLPAQAEIVVEECAITTDGIWCEGLFGERKGWFTRTALRDNTWPILTFVPLTPQPNKGPSASN